MSTWEQELFCYNKHHYGRASWVFCRDWCVTEEVGKAKLNLMIQFCRTCTHTPDCRLWHAKTQEHFHLRYRCFYSRLHAAAERNRLGAIEWPLIDLVQGLEERLRGEKFPKTQRQQQLLQACVWKCLKVWFFSHFSISPARCCCCEFGTGNRLHFRSSSLFSLFLSLSLLCELFGNQFSDFLSAAAACVHVGVFCFFFWLQNLDSDTRFNLESRHPISGRSLSTCN